MEFHKDWVTSTPLFVQVKEPSAIVLRTSGCFVVTGTKAGVLLPEVPPALVN
jgi:AMMECR1 domain-containing protein